MELGPKQFTLWHLIGTVTLCAVVLATVRALTKDGIAGAPLVVWVAIGIVIGHNGCVTLLAWLGPKDSRGSWSRNLIVWKAFFVWLSELGVTALALWLVTNDSDFARKNCLWLGTGFFVCFLGLYELFRPYRVERRRNSAKGVLGS